MTNPNVLPQIDHSKEVIIRLDMNTSKGTISLVLFPEYAPKAVENFVTHSENGYYDGLTFHRVIKGFMIQGGDPMGTGMGGESIYGHPFEDEFSLQLFHFRGALSMANSGPNTNGSQFFIVQSDELNPQFKSQLEQAGFPQAAIDQYIKEGGTPWLDHRHTVFGQVVEGFDVLDAIANVQVGPNDKPVEPVTIESITVHKG
ncbi:peptidylprolyl isomerase [Bacillus litorisediminis]|uniref:peptidylprolyl isomerase n=1 Tax=Bacillus litorisediminis TaxID=2922713 RepID=UPI001FAC4E3B|nr:peptidylprolyl isomerase [Bacillus litorisediminis]